MFLVNLLSSFNAPFSIQMGDHWFCKHKNKQINAIKRVCTYSQSKWRDSFEHFKMFLWPPKPTRVCAIILKKWNPEVANFLNNLRDVSNFPRRNLFCKTIKKNAKCKKVKCHPKYANKNLIKNWNAPVYEILNKLQV